MPTPTVTLSLPATLLLALSATCAQLAAAEITALSVGSETPTPDWAREELAYLAGYAANLDRIVDRFVDPETGYCTVTTDDWGTVDDIAEHLARQERVLLLTGSDRAREAYVSTWKGLYHLLGRVTNGFRDGYYGKGYDAEHAGELLQHLWGAMEMAPDDEELQRQNRRIAEYTLACLDPDSHLFGSWWMGSSGNSDQPKHQGCSNHDMIFINAWLREWMISGDERYRQATLELLAAWRDAAAANDGVMPAILNSDGSPREAWWSGPFGWDYGIPGCGERAWQSAITASVMITGGDQRYLEPFATTLDALVRHGSDGQIAGKFDGSTWQTSKHPWLATHLFDRLYDVSWNPAYAEHCQRFGSQYANHAYFGAAIDPAAHFAKRGILKTHRQRIEQRNPQTGDDLSKVIPKPNNEHFALIDGLYWAKSWGNQRCGGFLNTPLRYFRPDGGIGLPAGIAAWVHRVDADGYALRLYNSKGESQQVLISGGHYGQHRIERVDGHEVGAPRVLLTLPGEGLAEIEIELTRWAYRPTLSPQASDGTPVDVPTELP